MWILVWFYANIPEIKYALHNLDEEYIFELGPYAKALFVIFGGNAGGTERNKPLKMNSGEYVYNFAQDKGGKLAKFCQSVLLFHVTSFTEKEFAEFKEKIDEPIL